MLSLMTTWHLLKTIFLSTLMRNCWNNHLLKNKLEACMRCSMDRTGPYSWYNASASSHSYYWSMVLNLQGSNSSQCKLRSMALWSWLRAWWCTKEWTTARCGLILNSSSCSMQSLPLCCLWWHFCTSRGSINTGLSHGVDSISKLPREFSVIIQINST